MDRILVTEKIAPEGIEALKQAAEVDVRLDLTKEELLDILPNYDALVVRSATKVTADVIAAGTALRVIGRSGTGVDNIDVKTATERGIIVVNAPAANSVAVAELTIGFLLSLARQLPQAQASLRTGKWERSKFMGWEVQGKTLGLWGFGRIGAEVARRARALDMEVLAYDPVMSPERAAQYGVTPVSLDELLERSHVISLHMPLLDSTRNVVNAARLANMRQGAFLINAARGALIDETALYEALESGHLAGAALDTFQVEPPTPDNPLLSHPKVICVPHLGASTEEAQTVAGVDVAEGVVTALGGGTPRYAVNAPFVAPEEWAVLGPYIGLGRKLGSLCRQILQDPISRYEFEYAGELANMNTQPLRLAMIQGLLEGTSDTRITPVNAPLIARERGMRFDDRTTSELQSYSSLLYLHAISADGTVHTFAGTLLRNEVHIVQVDGYWVDFVPDGPLLCTYHRDRPGMIGRVGTLLGSADVNISGMYVGRLAPRAQAMMVLTLDEPVPADTLKLLNNEPDIAHSYNVTL
jgi:D-3-phosphoglycerate dehydrogenase